MTTDEESVDTDKAVNEASIKGCALALGALALALALASCSAAGTDAAKSVYDQCVKDDAKVQLLRHEKNTVTIEIDGDDARALSGMSDEVEKIGEDDASVDGMVIGLAMLVTSNCLVEATGFPGKAEQLRDGDAWDGWEYTETPGAGAEVSMTFTATK